MSIFSMHSLKSQLPRILLAAITLFCINSAVFAQGGIPMKTGKYLPNGQGVTGIVKPGTGFVQVMIYPGIPSSSVLSFADKSFVTFLINGTKYFTNNDLLSLPANTQILSDGVLSMIEDTIRCTWYNKEGVDLIQEIYPVVFEKSEQIVFRWKALNHNSTPTAVSLQYLLDLNIHGNDKSKVLTRSGYRPDWFQFNNNPDSVPPFYIAFENNLPNPPTFDPGISGQGYLDNTFYKLGLTKPSRVTVGDWVEFIKVLWGPPIGFSGDYGDAAILLEFPGGSAAKDKEALLAGTSYGTGEFERCIGQLFALEFYPHRIRWQDPNLVPNPFIIDMYTFNPSKTTSAPNTSITLTVDKDLTIITPNPITNGGKTQVQSVGNIQPLGVGLTKWSVLASKVDCLGSYLNSLKFNAAAGGLGYPIFLNEDGNGSDTCEHAITIECAQIDFLKPIAEKLDTSTPFIKTINARDNHAKDKGLRSITWAQVTGDSNNFYVSYTPVLSAPCDKMVHTITIKQKDSTLGGCIDFTLIDCVNLRTDTTICFPARPVAPTPDILPPVFAFVERLNKYDTLEGDCNFRFDSIIVTDSRPLDKGLLSVSVVGSPNNMTMRGLPITKGDPFYRFSVSVQDSFSDGSIIIEAVDAANPANKAYDTLTYCSKPDTAKPIVTINKTSRGQWIVRVREERVWDRLIDSIQVLGTVNVMFPAGSAPVHVATKGQSYYEFLVSAQDTSKPSEFCVQANDLMRPPAIGNVSDLVCVKQGIDPDTLAPNIRVTQDFGTNPWKITLNLDDIHKDVNGNVSPWDKGIDSVWYSTSNDIQTPGAKYYIPCVKDSVLSFELSVIDTMLVDTKTCITLYVRDCAGNINDTTWCYQYAQDLKPPTIRGQYASRAAINFTITDNLLSDRGNGTFDLTGDVNLTPAYKNQNISRTPIYQFSLNRMMNTSSTGTVQSVDYWGNNSLPVIKTAHTASVDFGIYVQNAGMRKGHLVREPGMFEIPVSLIETDTFSLSKKGINEYEFTIAINGDVSAVSFSKVRLDSSMSLGWTVTPTLTGNTLNIHGVKPSGGASLTDTSNGKLTLPLVILQFTAKKDDITRSITLDPMKIGAQTTETILYNNGMDTTYVGKNATATMPATYGTLSGSHIVILGACAPSLLQGTAGKPTIVTLDPNSPNPFTEKTNLQYTIREEGMVRLNVFDMLGKRVATLVDGVQEQGGYTIDFDARGLDGGSYVVRLEANGVVRSRMISFRK